MHATATVETGLPQSMAFVAYSGASDLGGYWRNPQSVNCAILLPPRITHLIDAYALNDSVFP